VLQRLFAAEAQHAVDGVGGAAVAGVEVADLKLAEQADAHHLDAAEDEHDGDEEERGVIAEDIGVGGELERCQRGGDEAAGEHAGRADGTEEVQRTRHVLQQETNRQQIEEDAEGAGDAVVALAIVKNWLRGEEVGAVVLEWCREAVAVYEPGLQPSDLWGSVTWGFTPGWYETGLWP